MKVDGTKVYKKVKEQLKKATIRLKGNGKKENFCELILHDN
jgi:hypothetical protein